jgi:hypothetical protein
MNQCSREEALSIAVKYLGEQYLGHLHASDDLPSPIYGTKAKKNSWVIAVPQLDSFYVGGSRFVLISKETGRIIFDGVVGE